MLEKPDKTDLAVRFGCGFVFGTVAFAGTMVFFFATYDRTILALVFVIALVFGVASMRYGDAFWRRITRWHFWW